MIGAVDGPYGQKNRALRIGGYTPEDCWHLEVIKKPSLVVLSKDDQINIRNWPVFSFFMPDGAAVTGSGADTFIFTSNEGDLRDDDGFSEKERVGDVDLDPTAFPNADFLQEKPNLGRLEISTVSGDIDTESVSADVTAGAVSGDVEVTGDRTEAETRANSVSGDVTLFRVAGNVAAESVSGDIIIDEGSFDRVNMNTVNGEILFQSELRDGGKLKAETVNGSVDVEFVGKVEGRFDIDTFNGDIDNCFGPKPQRTSKYTPGWELEFEEGDGDARITISTLNGDITLCR